MRGVCDGEVLLKEDMSICENAECIKQLAWYGHDSALGTSRRLLFDGMFVQLKEKFEFENPVIYSEFDLHA